MTAAMVCSRLPRCDKQELGFNGGMAMRPLHTIFAVGSVLIIAVATAARADVTISSDATANMSCSGGVCQPTASDAVLNIGDLENMLASGNVTVTTTGSGVQANNIDVTARLGWSANALTLDAYQSISVTAPVTTSGKSGLSILTNDGGSGGELAFSAKGHVTFKKLSGRLAINGTNYTMVNSIASLAAAIQKKPSGSYALAADYDASADGIYSSSPISTTFTGMFEGLGNEISNLTIDLPSVNQAYVGLFGTVGQGGQLSDVGLTRAVVSVGRVKGKFRFAQIGVLAGLNEGMVSRCLATGAVSSTNYSQTGGLIGNNLGTIQESRASVDINVANNSAGGGLVGQNGGAIAGSYATGTASGPESGNGGNSLIGGLVGFNNDSAISNSFATGDAIGGCCAGGLVGYNSSDVGTSYSTGKVQSPYSAGGFVGEDTSKAGSLSNDYWDTTSSGITDPSQGAGYPPNDPGITGLTTQQLRSGLPPGFDPSVWGENANINGGLPYLLANPPQ
jgi:hypothetical protein